MECDLLQMRPKSPSAPTPARSDADTPATSKALAPRDAQATGLGKTRTLEDAQLRDVFATGITPYLALDALASLSRTSHTLRGMLSHPLYWRRAMQARGMAPPPSLRVEDLHAWGQHFGPQRTPVDAAWASAEGELWQLDRDGRVQRLQLTSMAAPSTLPIAASLPRRGVQRFMLSHDATHAAVTVTGSPSNTTRVIDLLADTSTAPIPGTLRQASLDLSVVLLRLTNTFIINGRHEVPYRFVHTRLGASLGVMAPFVPYVVPVNDLVMLANAGRMTVHNLASAAFDSVGDVFHPELVFRCFSEDGATMATCVSTNEGVASGIHRTEDVTYVTAVSGTLFGLSAGGRFGLAYNEGKVMHVDLTAHEDAFDIKLLEPDEVGRDFVFDSANAPRAAWSPNQRRFAFIFDVAQARRVIVGAMDDEAAIRFELPKRAVRTTTSLSWSADGAFLLADGQPLWVGPT